VALDKQPQQPPALSKDGGTGLNRPIVRPPSSTLSAEATVLLPSAATESTSDEGGADDIAQIRPI
jgi:hypothetical protein